MKLRRGAYVTEMNRRDAIEAYELLALLESDATARHWLVTGHQIPSWRSELPSTTVGASGQDHRSLRQHKEAAATGILGSRTTAGASR